MLKEIDKKELVVERQSVGLSEGEGEEGEPRLMYPLKRRKCPPSHAFAAVPEEPQGIEFAEEPRLVEEIEKAACEMDGGVPACSPIPWSPLSHGASGPLSPQPPPPAPPPPCPLEPSPRLSLPALRLRCRFINSDSDSLPASPVVLRGPRRSDTTIYRPTHLHFIPEEPDHDKHPGGDQPDLTTEDLMGTENPTRAEDPGPTEDLGGAEDPGPREYFERAADPRPAGALPAPPTLREAYEEYLRCEAEEGSAWLWSESQFKAFVWDLVVHNPEVE